jgi:hypothetical protein
LVLVVGLDLVAVTEPHAAAAGLKSTKALIRCDAGARGLAFRLIRQLGAAADGLLAGSVQRLVG